MTIWIDNSTSMDIFEDYDRLIENTVNSCIELEQFPTNIEVSVSIVDNLQIQKLNFQFRNIDSPTDVLSFPMLDFKNIDKDSIADENINRDTGDIILGDIIISIEQAIKQSNEFGHSIQREIAFLTAHSMFHLMGYDHQNPDDEAIMIKKQKEALARIGILR